jgi:HD superfamily phosphodiesterase
VLRCQPFQVVDLSAEEYAASAARGSPTYDHFFEKLLKLKGMMKTQAGRAAAEVRHQVRLFVKVGPRH